MGQMELQRSADKWNEGFAAIFAVASGGLLLFKLPDTATDAGVWHTVAAILAALGSCAALAGLWRALQASAGKPLRLSRDAFMRKYGSIVEFRRRRAEEVARDLAFARGAVAVSIGLTLVSVAVVAIAPSEEAGPYTRVVSQAGTICGRLIPAGQDRIKIATANDTATQEYKLDEISSLQVVPTCSP